MRIAHLEFELSKLDGPLLPDYDREQLDDIYAGKKLVGCAVARQQEVMVKSDAIGSDSEARASRQVVARTAADPHQKGLR
jgi:hypothetical protein